jgi:hypothetical protein
MFSLSLSVSTPIKAEQMAINQSSQQKTNYGGLHCSGNSHIMGTMMVYL